MQCHHPFELIGEMAAPFRLALGEGLLGAIVGMRQVIDAGQHGPKNLRLATMPPTLMPPKFTP